MNTTVAAPAIANNTQTVNPTTNTNPVDPKAINNTANKTEVVEPWKQAKHKVKIDGNELEVDYDDLVKNYQLSKVSLSKMNEATKQMDLARSTIKAFKDNPSAAFKELGVDAKQWAEQFIMQSIEEESLSPEQREKKELMNKLKAFEDEKATTAKEKETVEFNQRVAQFQQDISNKMVESLKTSGLPTTEGTVKRMADYMLQFARAGHDVEPKDVIDYVKQDYMNEHKQFYADSDIDKLIETLGEKKVAEIVKAHTKGYRSNANKADPKVARPANKPNTNKGADKQSTMSLEKKMRELRAKNGLKY